MTNAETLIPIVVAGIIAVATLAIVPILKTLSELKKSNEEIHKIVNSNFTAQTIELKAANDRVGQLLQLVEAGNTRIADLLLITSITKTLNIEPKNGESIGSASVRKVEIESVKESEGTIKKRADEIRHQANEIKKSV